MASYKYDKASRMVEPARTLPYPELMIETAPREWWCCDLLETRGAKFREIADDVKTMCSDVLGEEIDYRMSND